ncbi:MAG: 30S ribosomal protein S5 [Pseudomonadales bacterium]|nr:30S ribosomal protein S5 [Pseudomonadales bacterium]
MRTIKQQEPKEFEEKVIQISRVSKKTKGGNNVGFSVLMVVGDKKGRVGVGLGKAKDVVSAIRKGIKKAKKKMITVPLNGTTIPFSITVKKGAGRVMLKPAPQGSGVIAGGPVRSVVEAAGVRDISSKILGSENQSSSVYATFEALTQIQRIVELKGIKLKSIADVEAEEAEKQKELQEKHAKRAEATENESKDKKAPAKVAKKPAAKKTAAKKAPAKKVAPKKAPKAEEKK